jgi:hypothetical protein
MKIVVPTAYRKEADVSDDAKLRSAKARAAILHQ